MLKSFFISLVIGITVGGMALAEPVSSLTLEQAIQSAIANNPQVKAVRSRLGVSEAEILSAGLRPNPSLLSDNGIAEKTYRVGVEQTIELGGKRRNRIALAKAQRDVVLADINTQLLDLRTDVRRAYTQLYSAQERQKIYKNILQVSQELADVAKKRERAGDVSKLNVLETEIVSINANNELQTSMVEVVNGRSRLNAILNQPLHTDLALAPPSSSPQLTSVPVSAPPAPQGAPVLQGGVNQLEADLDGLIQAALSHRPEIQQNLRQVEVTRFQTALARANRIPNLSLAAGPDIVTGDEGETSVFIIGNLELPLFNRQQGAIHEAQARRVQLEQEQMALKNRITYEVSSAYNSFKANQERIQRYETQLLPYSVAIVDKSRRAFDEGKTSILNAIYAQQAYMNTRLGYLQALIDFQNSISDLERAVGTGL